MAKTRQALDRFGKPLGASPRNRYDLLAAVLQAEMGVTPSDLTDPAKIEELSKRLDNLAVEVVSQWDKEIGPEAMAEFAQSIEFRPGGIRFW